MIKYALHPQIISTVDNKLHYIGYIELIQLYGLDFNECIMWNSNRPELMSGRDPAAYIHLYPRPDGNYKP